MTEYKYNEIKELKIQYTRYKDYIAIQDKFNLKMSSKEIIVTTLLSPYLLPGALTVYLADFNEKYIHDRNITCRSALPMLVWPIVLPFVIADISYSIITCKVDYNKMYNKYKEKNRGEEEIKILENDYKKFLKYRKDYQNEIKNITCSKCNKRQLESFLTKYQIKNNNYEYECIDCNIWV